VVGGEWEHHDRDAVFAPGPHLHSPVLLDGLSWWLRTHIGCLQAARLGLQVPNARLGVSPRGIGLIIRSIQATVGLSLTAEEDALLRSVDANAEDVVPWPQDVERYGPVLDNLRLLLRGAEDREGWIWLSAQDARWWIENSSEALREYEEELRASDPVLLDHLVSRHE